MALSPLEALRTLMSGGGQLNSMTEPSSSLLKNNPAYKQLSPVPTEDYGWSGAVPTRGELESPWEQEQTRVANAANARDRAATQDIDASNLKAILSGYGGTTKIDQGPLGYSASGPTQSPAARMAAAQREADVAKSRIPIDVANITQAGETGRTAETLAQQSRIESMKEAAATQRANQSLEAAKKMLGMLPEGGKMELAGGGQVSRAYSNLPTGPEGVKVDQAIKARQDLEHESPWDLGGMFASGTLQERKIAAERALDQIFPAWRARLRANDPTFKFATGAEAQQPVGAPIGAATPHPAAPSGGVKMRAPDGRSLTVPPEKVQELLQHGATLVQ